MLSGKFPRLRLRLGAFTLWSAGATRSCWRMCSSPFSAAKSPRAARGPLYQRGLSGPPLYQRGDRGDFASSIAMLAPSEPEAMLQANKAPAWLTHSKIAPPSRNGPVPPLVTNLLYGATVSYQETYGIQSFALSPLRLGSGQASISSGQATRRGESRADSGHPRAVQRR